MAEVPDPETARGGIIHEVTVSTRARGVDNVIIDPACISVYGEALSGLAMVCE